MWKEGDKVRLMEEDSPYTGRNGMSVGEIYTVYKISDNGNPGDDSREQVRLKECIGPGAGYWIWSNKFVRAKPTNAERIAQRKEKLCST
jgi:hypothetical protein